jgi:predicted Rossmann fold flavoprotein
MAIDNTYDFIIVGAGAAGLSSAVSFGHTIATLSKDVKIEGFVPRFALIDGNREAGKKILATGNGRCNLSNLAAEGYRHSKSFFESLGILLEQDAEGRVYPKTHQAKTVRDALVTEALRFGAEFILGKSVTDIRTKDGGGFSLCVRGDGTEEEFFVSSRLMIATGGKASPAYGNYGDGFTFARKFGHHVSSIRPVLVPMCFAPHAKALSVLKGVRANAMASLFSRGECIASERGEVQFTEEGLSGICIFNLSRYLSSRNHLAGAQIEVDANHVSNSEDEFSVRLDFVPDVGFWELSEFLGRDGAAGMAGVVNHKIADYAETVLTEVQGAGNKTRAALLKGFDVPIKGTKGWKAAQATAGGVLLDEVDVHTLESKMVEGLYFSGEVLDYDGPSGGYNLNHAWVTGLKSGYAAAKDCLMSR